MKNRKIYRYTQGELKINLYKQTPSGNPEFFYNMIHNIGGVPVNMINASDVQVYIDNGSAVLGVYAFRTNYVEFNPSGISHMVTIVGYDNNNYICIDPGYISPRLYPTTEFNPNFFYGYSMQP